MKKVFEMLPGVRENVLLKDYTTFKIGGPARYFFIAKNKEDLIKAVGAAKTLKLPIFILGGGSNLLVSEKGFNGLVIKISVDDIKFHKNKITVGAGVELTKASNLLANKRLSGLEWSAGIPSATIGGAIYGHAQAFGERISDIVKNVKILDLKNLKIKNLNKKQCQFALKNSVFKKNKNLVIISAELELKKKNPKEAKNKIKENIEFRITRHPMDFPSAGSVFVNPEAKVRNPKLLKKFPELKEFNLKGAIPAGYLIEKCGLKGKKVGNAQFSEKHANFIINLGGAKAKDVLALILLAKKEVKKVFGIELETEVQMAGF